MGLTILVIGLCGNLNSAEFKPGSEPDGFRGIKWGTDISTLSDMEYSWTDPSCGGTKAYHRKSDDLHLGAAKLKEICYYFWREKFCNVYVLTEDYVNWAGLKKTVFEKFGEGSQNNKYIESYVWYDDITTMTLGYNEISERGELWMFSKEITKQQDAYKKQKAKEGAEKGF